MDIGRMARRAAPGIGLAVLLGLLLAPLTATSWADDLGISPLVDKLQLRVLTTIAMFVVITSAWNLIGGLTGYAAFGNVAFFGLGAYATAILIDRGHLPFGIALLAAPLVPAAFAFLIGLPLLRLRGHYFAVSTLGVSVAVGEVIRNLDYFGGSTGIFLPIDRRSDVKYFYLMAGAALLAVLAAFLVRRSRLGFGLIAIRENEDAAAVIGINTTLYKVLAYCLSAALTGLVGGIFAQWTSFISQDNVFPNEYNIRMVLMGVMGGTGTVLGPVAGAVVLEWLIESFAGRGDISIIAQMGLGLLLIVTVLVLPKGMVGFFTGEARLSWAYLKRSLSENSV